MDCPHCGADKQTGYFCESCGKPLRDLPKESDRLIFGRFSSTQVIAFLSGLLVMLLAGFIFLFVTKDSSPPSSGGQAVVVSQGQPPEDAAQKALREAAVISPELPEDKIVGYYRHYIDGIKIDKIGDASYRMDLEGDLYRLTYQAPQYLLEDGNVRYYFSLTPSADLQLDGADRPSGLQVENPIFESQFKAFRLQEDGSEDGEMTVNMDVFQILGKTYGQLAGTYGPGALTVIGDDQFIVFHTSQGKFAVSFTGETVPLSAQAYGATAPSLRPLTDQIAPAPGSLEGDTETQEDDDTEDPGQASQSPSQTPVTPQPDTLAPAPQLPQGPLEVEVPNMPTFPSNTAVAQGVVWADLSFFLTSIPETISLDDLSRAMGVTFQTGPGTSWLNGYKIYGGAEGYFVANYGTDYGTFKVSGYGKEQLHRDKTRIFIERVS